MGLVISPRTWEGQTSQVHPHLLAAIFVGSAITIFPVWLTRVWPGAVLVAGEIVGIWRRGLGTVTIQAWRRLTRAARDAVEAEVASLPLPDLRGRLVVRWED